ncbi:MAG TPA: EamA family transporter [Capillimicrobium sp.]|nr:EamA family transporter [Capillimicrobium sp.]
MSLRAWSCFAAVSVLWGIPYLFIKLAVEEVPPAFVAWGRVVIGAAILLPWAWRAGLLAGLRGRMRWALLWGLTEIAIPFPLIAFGEQHVSSSLTAILIASAPLMVALLGEVLDPAERVRGARLAGLVIGLAGVVALMGIDVAGRADELLGAGAILLGTLCYAVGPFNLRGPLAGADSIGVVAVALAFAAVALTPLVIADPPAQTPSGTAIASIVVLGVLCSAAALVLFAILVAEVGGGRAMVITYVAPVVAVALGVTILGESLGAAAVAGLLLILAGSWLATGGRLPPGLGGLLRIVGARRRPSPGPG